MITQNHISLSDALELYLSDCATYYAGSRETKNLESGLRLLLRDLIDERLIDLDGPTLAKIRDELARAGELARSTINKRLQYVHRFIGWCVEQGIAEPEQLVSIKSVRKLRRGRYGVRESEPVRAPSMDDVRAALPLMPVSLRSMMRLIIHTGMRPGEARIMRACDLEVMQHKGERLLCYTPPRHKTAHLGKSRRVFIAGSGCELVQSRISTLIGSSLFEPCTQGYLFSPDNDGERCYSHNSVHQGVRRACVRAGVKWTPNQLRHLYATISRADGVQLELIGDLLGHSDVRTTQIYAEPDERAAIEAAIRLARA